MKPTEQTYFELQQAYDVFNRILFDNELPECLITLQKANATRTSFFYAKRFSNRLGEKIDEIAMNPTFFAVVPLVEIMQKLAHSMCHVWQHNHGQPGRGPYHNVQWADKMESIGLMPSSTGEPGGARTGDSVKEYAVKGGMFLEACEELITQEFTISWYDLFAPESPISSTQHHVSSLDLPDAALAIAADDLDMISNHEQEPENKPSGGKRSKYTCHCDINVWGKSGLNIICGNCDNEFVEQKKNLEAIDE